MLNAFAKIKCPPPPQNKNAALVTCDLKTIY